MTLASIKSGSKGGPSDRCEGHSFGLSDPPQEAAAAALEVLAEWTAEWVALEGRREPPATWRGPAPAPPTGEERRQLG